MQSITTQLAERFRTAIHAAFPKLLLADIDPMIAVSQNEKFGDYQSNVAMGLAKTLSASGTKMNPRGVADAIKTHLQLSDLAEDPTIAGAGFINVKLKASSLAKQLADLEKDENFGVAKSSHPQTVIVEYSSPNIAKQMHVGHIRTTIIGDALARVYELIGERVIRQNHIGDWGTQFGKVILSIWYQCMSQHASDPDWPTRIGQRLAASKNDLSLRGELIADIAQSHQAFLDADPKGLNVFAPYLARYVPELARIEPVYQFVSAIEETLEAKSFTITDSRGRSASLADQSKVITSMLQAKSEQEILAWEKVKNATLEACQKLYDRLGVQLTLDDVRGESFYDPMLRDVVDDLRQLGIAEESEGAMVVFVDGRERSPLIIEKSKGHGFLYATTDLAAIRYRATVLKAARVLYVVDSRQSQHFRQVFEVAKRARWGEGTRYEHAAFGTVLGLDGKPMKTREGDNVKLADLLDEAESRGIALVKAKSAERGVEVSEAAAVAIGKAVGIGAIKYADLSKDRTTDYIFAWESMLATVGNTGPYLQYAFARICSIFRKAERSMESAASAISLDSPFELALAKHVLRFGDVVNLVAQELKPHLLCTYLFELATRFSGFFENCPVTQSGEPLRSSRLALCAITAKTLSAGLDLLGIEHPEQM